MRSLASLLLLVLSACGGAPSVPVDDPHAYLVDALREAELNTWWEPYADRSDEFLALVVDSLAESLPSGLPSDSRGLDRLLMRARGRYRSLSLDEEHRDHLLRAARARFEDPPMAIVEGRVDVALLDFHHVPGAWGKTGRVGEVFKDSPAIAGLRELEHETLVRALNALAERFPDAHRYQVRVRFFSGASPHKLTVQVDRDARILKHAGPHSSFTSDPVDWDRLLAGDVRLDELRWETPMEGNGGPGFTNAHPEPLPRE